MTDAEKLSAIQCAYAEYRQALKERQHGGVAASNFVATVAIILAEHPTDQPFTFREPAEYPLRPSFLV